MRDRGWPSLSSIGVFLAEQWDAKKWPQKGSPLQTWAGDISKRFQRLAPKLCQTRFQGATYYPTKNGLNRSKKIFFHFFHTFLLKFRRLVWAKKFFEGDFPDFLPEASFRWDIVAGQISVPLESSWPSNALWKKRGESFQKDSSLFLAPAISRRRFSGWAPNFGNLVSRAQATIPPKMGSIGQKKFFFIFPIHSF